MRCYVCGRRLRGGDRCTVLTLVNAVGDPSGEWMMHESCKADLVAGRPDLFGSVPEVDLDLVQRKGTP
jgi:hypothetical protein